MRAEDKERLARRQRMLARERGETLPEPEPEKNEEKPSESKVDDQESAVKDTKGKKGRERRVGLAGRNLELDDGSNLLLSHLETFLNLNGT